MVIEYGNSKEVKCYRDFVLQPDNRGAARAFSKKLSIPFSHPTLTRTINHPSKQSLVLLKELDRENGLEILVLCQILVLLQFDDLLQPLFQLVKFVGRYG